MTSVNDSLQLRSASISYDGRHYALFNTSLTLSQEMEPLGLIGASGCGKTTLVRAIMSWHKVSSGSVEFNGRNVNSLKLSRKKYYQATVRAVAQANNPYIVREKSLGKALSDAYGLAKSAGRNCGLEPNQLLELVGLKSYVLNKYSYEVSGGELQRFALVTALATTPKILILDEPLTAIDEHSRYEFAKWLSTYVKEHQIGLFLSAHDVNLIKQLTSRVLVMEKGQIVAQGELHTLLQEQPHPYLADLAKAINLSTADAVANYQKK